MHRISFTLVNIFVSYIDQIVDAEEANLEGLKKNSNKKNEHKSHTN
jgi:hypothetical protein